jgi:hypothetical protein
VTRRVAILGGSLDAAGVQPAVDPIGQQQLRTAGARLIDLFAGLLQESVEAYLELAQSIVRSPGGGAAARDGGGLSLRGAPGARATTTVWIHNAAPQPCGEILLALTDLQAANGARIDGSRGRFVPAALRLEGGASASSLLTLSIAPGTPAGTYFGHVLVTGLPACGLPLQLAVEGAAAR